MTTARLVGAWVDTAIDAVRGVVLTYANTVAIVLAAALLLPALMGGPRTMPVTDNDDERQDERDDDDEPFDRHDLDCAVWTTLCGGCTCGVA